jgi:hypothetical protein
MTETIKHGSSLQSKELVSMEVVKSGKKVILGKGIEALVIKKAKNKSVFKDIYPWVVTMGTKDGELIKEAVKSNGVAFKNINGTLSDNSILKVL